METCGKRYSCFHRKLVKRQIKRFDNHFFDSKKNNLLTFTRVNINNSGFKEKDISLFVIIKSNPLTDIKLRLIRYIGRRYIIEIKNAPTYFGELNFNLQIHIGHFELTVDVKTPPPDGYKLTLPLNIKIRSVTVNKREWKRYSENIVILPAAAKKIKIDW